MTIKDYITKNLTNLNWNILPQIFEENNVELTEEIEAYLRNTPENTNWNVFDGMVERGSSDTLPKKLIVTRGNGNSYNFTESSDFQSFEELQAFIDKYKFREDEHSYYHMPSNTITLINVIDGVEYPAPDDNPGSQNGTYWTWYEDGGMEWRLDLMNQTLGYYSYDD